MANWKEGMKKAWGWGNPTSDTSQPVANAADSVTDASTEMINVDSPHTVTHNYYSEDARPGGAVTRPSPQTPSKLGTLAKLAIGAGLIGTGVGGAYGIPLALDALRDGKTIIERRVETPVINNTADAPPSPVYYMGLAPPE